MSFLFSRITFNEKNRVLPWPKIFQAAELWEKTKHKKAKSPRKEINSITPFSSLPSLGFSHESTSPCHIVPQFCQLVCNVTSAWYCAPEQEEFAVMSCTLNVADKLHPM